jgi:hypothetical protein
VRVRRLVDGILVGDQLTDHAGPVSALGVGAPGRDPVVLSGGEDGTVRVSGSCRQRQPI